MGDTLLSGGILQHDKHFAMHVARRKIFVRFSSYSEAIASKLLESLVEMLVESGFTHYIKILYTQLVYNS